MRSGEERLRYYAQHFDTVEANSTYYRLPEESMVANWAERVPDGFVMHVKAFGMMTRHPVKADVLPPDLREGAPADERGRVDRPPRELRAEVFARFHAALEPLRTAGKLGGILLQFPSYIVCKPYSFEYLEWAKEQLRGDHMLVEFRHRSWMDEENRERVLAFLEELGATHVIVDAPKTEAKNLVPTVVALTSSDRIRPSARKEREDLERARQERGRALRLPVLGGRAEGVDRTAGGARRGRGRGLCHVQQQRPLAGARRAEGVDLPSADERADAAPDSPGAGGTGMNSPLSG